MSQVQACLPGLSHLMRAGRFPRGQQALPADGGRLGSFPGGGLPIAGVGLGAVRLGSEFHEARMELRAATLRDARAIAVVHVAWMRQAYRGLFPSSALGGIDFDDRAKRRQTLTDPRGTTLVVEADGKILGFVHDGL